MIDRQIREPVQTISHRFTHLNHLAYFVSLTSGAIGIGGGILLGLSRDQHKRLKSLPASLPNGFWGTAVPH